MAEGLYLVSKANAEDPQEQLIDGIHCVLINADDASTTAEICADAVTACVRAGHAIPTGYFDTVADVDDLTSGPLPDDTDAYIILPRELELTEA